MRYVDNSHILISLLNTMTIMLIHAYLFLLEDIADLYSNISRHIHLSLVGRSTQMRSADHILMLN